MKKVNWFFVILLIVVLPGCASNNINRVAEDQQVVAPMVMPVDKETEGLLRVVFTETELAWDSEDLKEIDSCIAALNKESDYIKSLLNLTGQVPYFEYRASVNRALALTNDIKSILSERVEIPGAVTDVGKGYYNLLIEKILRNANAQRLNLASEEAKINKAATAMDIAELENLYNQLAPLVKTAMDVAL